MKIVFKIKELHESIKLETKYGMEQLQEQLCQNISGNG
jgi:hypothetical protein